MTLPSTGPLKFSDIQTEFGGIVPVSFSEYYAGVTYVATGTTGLNGAIPASGVLSISKFRGSQHSLPVGVTQYTSVLSFISASAYFTAGGVGYNIAYGNGIFVAMVYSGLAPVGYYLVTSPDGITWSMGVNPFGTNGFNKIYFVNGVFIVLKTNRGNAWSATLGGMSYSTDCQSWTNVPTLPYLTAVTGWAEVAVINNTYVVTAGTSTGSNQSARSTDNGVNYVAGGVLPTASNWTAASAGNINGTDTCIAYGTTTSAAKTVDGGVTWTSFPKPSSPILAHCFDGTKFIGLGLSSTLLLYTSNATSWTSGTLPLYAQWRSMAFGGGYYVAVASDTGSYLVSTDGINWTVRTGLNASNQNMIAYGNGYFVSIVHGAATVNRIVP